MIKPIKKMTKNDKISAKNSNLLACTLKMIVVYFHIYCLNETITLQLK